MAKKYAATLKAARELRAAYVAQGYEVTIRLNPAAVVRGVELPADMHIVEITQP